MRFRPGTTAGKSAQRRRRHRVQNRGQNDAEIPPGAWTKIRTKMPFSVPQAFFGEFQVTPQHLYFNRVVV
jgi:hypothetical protein